MWTEEQRVCLDLILDELIPASPDGRVPGAGALGVAEFLPSATPYAPDPVGAINKVLKAVLDKACDFATLASYQRVSIMRDVEDEESEAFGTLLRVTYMGYYSCADVRPLFGVGAHPIHPDGYPVVGESDNLLQELTAPVCARGETYRSG